MSQQLTHTVGSLLDDMARRYPDNEALVYPERGLRYSYKQFNDTCRQIAKGCCGWESKKGTISPSGPTTSPNGSCCNSPPPKSVPSSSPSTPATNQPNSNTSWASPTPPRSSWSASSKTPTTSKPSPESSQNWLHPNRANLTAPNCHS